MGTLMGDDDRTAKRSFNARSKRNLSARLVNTEWAVTAQPGAPLRRCNQMSLLGPNGLRFINQAALPDTLTASRRVIEQPKPLRIAATPRANEPRPKPVVGKKQDADSNMILDPTIAELNTRRLRVPLEVATRHQSCRPDHS